MSGQTIKLNFILIFLVLWLSSCGCPNLRMGYIIQGIYSLENGTENITDDFRVVWMMGFLEDGKIDLPFYRDHIVPYPVEYSTYQYDRKECTLIMDDHIQNFFCGEYTVQFFSGDPPQVWLESDKLRIILKEVRFTLEQPFIPIEWPKLPQRDSL